MIAAQKIERLPEEIKLEEFFEEGRAIKTRISMKAVGKPDVRFQARVEHLDLGHVSRLEAMVRDMGDTFPLVVFYNPKTEKHILADGFHRHEAYRRAKRADVPAYQITSDDPEQEALEYCTMCNRLALKTRNKEDIRKAVEMMIRNEVTRIWNDGRIARHVGCSVTLVASRRIELKAKAGIHIPNFSIGINDRVNPRHSTKKNGTPKVCVAGRGFTVSIDGKRVNVRDRDEAQDIAAVAKDERDRLSRLCTPKSTNLKSFLRIRHVFRESIQQTCRPQDFFLADLIGGFLVSRCDVRNGSDLREAIGHVRQAWLETGRKYQMVVMCDTGAAPKSITDVFSREDGVLFLTPDELVDRVKASS